jgi:hypothetical protein
LWCWGSLPQNGVRVERLRAEIAEHLPAGSTRDQVEAWFASHGFETWDISTTVGRKGGLGATIPNSSWWEDAEIEIEFYFDEAGRLARSFIDRFVYSL